MELKKALPILDRFITWASPIRIVMLTCIALVLIGSLTIFEKRNAIVSGLAAHNQSETGAPPEFKLELTADVKDQVISLVKRSPDISMIAVFTANLRINQRNTIFYYTNEPSLDLVMRNQLSGHGTTYPIFTTNDKSNLQMVSVINGEFSCHKFADTISATRMPEAVRDMPFICQVSLPPYYGDFSGYLIFGLRKMPDKNAMDDLQLEAVKLSTDIYFKAISKRRHY
jgi:hypothetical protein